MFVVQVRYLLVDNTNERFEFQTIRISDDSVLRRSLVHGEVVTVSFDVELVIDSTICAG